MLDAASFKMLMAAAPALEVRTQLARIVPFAALAAYHPPNWLYTSGRPNRYNPQAVNCIYFSEDRQVAQAEYEAMWKSLAGKMQPVTLYHAAVTLRRVLDLTNETTRKILKVNTSDLFANWRCAKFPTVTQLMGQAVNDSRLFCAIRYPSKAADDRGLSGVNYVIFRDCVHYPDAVRIIGPVGQPLQQWPPGDC